MKKFLHILFFEIFVLSAEAVHPCLTFYYTPLASIPQYWHYVCRSFAPLHPHLVFHFVSLTNVPNVELIVSDGSSRQGNFLWKKFHKTSHDAPFTNKLYGSPKDG